MVRAVAGRLIPRRADSPKEFLGFVSVRLDVGIVLNNIAILKDEDTVRAEFFSMKGLDGITSVGVSGALAPMILDAAIKTYMKAQVINPDAEFPKVKEIAITLR